MIHVMLPTQYLSTSRGRLADPHKRLMAAVLQAVIDDCRGGTHYRRSVGCGTVDSQTIRKANAYVASPDRTWPFSFENLCEALGLDAAALRQALEVGCGVSL